MKHIPYARQDISQADIDSVVDVLNSEYLTQGPAVPNFEHSVLSFCGAKHAVAVNSATSALSVSGSVGILNSTEAICFSFASLLLLFTYSFDRRNALQIYR